MLRHLWGGPAFGLHGLPARPQFCRAMYPVPLQQASAGALLLGDFMAVATVKSRSKFHRFLPSTLRQTMTTALDGVPIQVPFHRPA